MNALADLVWIAPVLLLAGCATGVLAGLFGVGGGGVIVPVLYQTLRLTGIDDSIAMPVAVGTSLAIIVPTSLNSARGHFERGAVDMNLVRAWAAPVILGVMVGAGVARYAPSALFKLVFIALCAFTTFRMFGGYSDWRLKADSAPKWVERASGFGVGLFSSLMGVGGGQLVNLYMSLYGAPIHRAVGTAAAVGTLVAAPGALGFMLAGWGKAGLPPLSIGFVSVLSFCLIAPTATLCAPIGVRIAHGWTKRQLEIGFGVFLVAIIARFLISLIWKA